MREMMGEVEVRVIQEQGLWIASRSLKRQRKRIFPRLPGRDIGSPADTLNLAHSI